MEEVSPGEARELMSEKGYEYLDVRSKPEFHAGRPQGARNIPILDADAAGRLVPNPDFLQQVQSQYGQDSKIICGCKSGGRSARAAEILSGAGYSRVLNMRGGFGGARDPQSGEVLEEGWSQLGLPTEQG